MNIATKQAELAYLTLKDPRWPAVPTTKPCRRPSCEACAGGADLDIHFAIGECFLGPTLVAQNERGVCSILIGNESGRLVRELQDQFPKAHLTGAEGGCGDLVVRTTGLVESPSIGLDLPLDPQGEVFQRRVWKALQQMPIGGAASYANIARKIGFPKAAREVAQACGSNTLATPFRATALSRPTELFQATDGAWSGNARFWNGRR